MIALCEYPNNVVVVPAGSFARVSETIVSP